MGAALRGKFEIEIDDFAEQGRKKTKRQLLHGAQIVTTNLRASGG